MTPTRALTTAASLKRFHGKYKRDGNPLWVWRAIWEAHASDARLPLWALDYLGDVASDVLELAARARLDNKAFTDSNIVRALGFKRTGAGTLASREHRTTRNTLIARDVALRVAAPIRSHERHKLADIYADVARAWRVDPKVARDAYRGRLEKKSRH